MRKRWLVSLLVASLIHPALAGVPPPLMLATDYDGALHDLHEYWVSEKLDGVRARWNGKQLVSRQGNVFRAPSWFIEGFPAEVLDGELWMGRGTFPDVSGAVRKQEPVGPEWKRIRFMVFDAPEHGGTFDERLAALRDWLSPPPSPRIALVEQGRVPTREALIKRLDEVVARGGEGLMLHHGDALYAAGRSRGLLKLKPFSDAEACVVGYVPGKGRLAGRLGSLLVEAREGRRFRLGTGFSDEEREAPPLLGSVVTYRYRGRTGTGLPRFPSFLRVRHDAGTVGAKWCGSRL